MFFDIWFVFVLSDLAKRWLDSPNYDEETDCDATWQSLFFIFVYVMMRLNLEYEAVVNVKICTTLNSN